MLIFGLSEVSTGRESASKLNLMAVGRMKYFMGYWTAGLTSLLVVEVHLHNQMNERDLSSCPSSSAPLFHLQE